MVSGRGRDFARLLTLTLTLDSEYPHHNITHNLVERKLNHGSEYIRLGKYS